LLSRDSLWEYDIAECATTYQTSTQIECCLFSLSLIMSLLSRIVLLFLPAVVLALAPPLLTVQYDAMAGLDDVRVPVLLGVMSRCPDALLCEAVFDQVLNKVIGITDLKLIYVGQ